MFLNREQLILYYWLKRFYYAMAMFIIAFWLLTHPWEVASHV